jgi:hypothetical protein
VCASRRPITCVARAVRSSRALRWADRVRREKRGDSLVNWVVLAVGLAAAAAAVVALLRPAIDTAGQGAGVPVSTLRQRSDTAVVSWAMIEALRFGVASQPPARGRERARMAGFIPVPMSWSRRRLDRGHLVAH